MIDCQTSCRPRSEIHREFANTPEGDARARRFLEGLHEMSAAEESVRLDIAANIVDFANARWRMKYPIGRTVILTSNRIQE